MSWISRLMAAAAMTVAVGATVAYAEKEEEIPLSKVPTNVLAVAQRAVPGIKLTAAEVEKTRKGLVYELEGTLEGKDYEIEVSADGKILEIEQEGDDDEEENEEAEREEE